MFNGMLPSICEIWLIESYVNTPGKFNKKQGIQHIRIEQKESKNKPKSKAVKAAAKVAKEYYSGSVFKVISMEMSSRTKNEIIFSVCVSKDGIIQDPDRSITLKLKNGTWKVTGEGY